MQTRHKISPRNGEIIKYILKVQLFYPLLAFTAGHFYVIPAVFVSKCVLSKLLLFVLFVYFSHYIFITVREELVM